MFNDEMYQDTQSLKTNGRAAVSMDSVGRQHVGPTHVEGDMHPMAARGDFSPCAWIKFIFRRPGGVDAFYIFCLIAE